MPNANDSGWASTVVVGCLTGIALTADWLPREVAGYFALDGTATGFVAREAYVAVAISSAVLLPSIVCGGLWLAVVRFPAFMTLPHRGYWLAPERRGLTASFLAARGAWLAALLALFTFALHLLVLHANTRMPARLDYPVLLALMVGLCTAFGAWLNHIQRHFARIENATQ